MRVDQVTEALNRKNTIDMPGGNQSQAPPGLPNPPNTGGGHAADEDDDVDALRALKNAYMRMYRSIKSNLSNLSRSGWAQFRYHFTRE